LKGEKEMGLFKKENKIRQDTHPFTNLFIILVAVTILANFIPGGAYQRIEMEGRNVVDPSSFAFAAEKVYVGVGTFFKSFFNGFKDASSLMAMIFFAGAAFGVVTRIGLMETALKALTRKLEKTSFYVVAFVLMAVWGTMVAFTSMWELAMVMIPVVVPLALALGYDVVTGAGIIILSSCAGFAASLTNPLFTAIAHKIAELPIYSGMWYRAIVFVTMLLIGYAFLMNYARKVKKDPSKAVVKVEDTKYAAYTAEEKRFTPALIRAGITFVLLFAFLIYGTVELKFDFPEIAATFAAMSIIVGLVYGLSLNDTMIMKGEGMKDMFFGAMVMLFARAVLYVMNTAGIIDTIIFYLSKVVVGKSAMVSASFLPVMQAIIDFFIPSGSGQAVITIPILVPLGDMSGITRQTVCLAAQLGDGLANFIMPTEGTLLGILMVAGIPYKKWFKFFGPLWAILMAVAIISVIIAVAIHLGPF
jgi:uncharacterized ion transporter superfamily protein YfcC